MAESTAAQATMNEAIASGGKGQGSAASGRYSPLRTRRRGISQSPPSATLPKELPPRDQSAIMESLEATVQALMRKLDVQAETIAQLERRQGPDESAAHPEQFHLSPGAAEEGYDDGGKWTERRETTGPSPAPGISQPVEDPAASEADPYHYQTEGRGRWRGADQENRHELPARWNGYGTSYGGSSWWEDPFMTADPWTQKGWVEQSWGHGNSWSTQDAGW